MHREARRRSRRRSFILIAFVFVCFCWFYFGKWHHGLCADSHECLPDHLTFPSSLAWYSLTYSDAIEPGFSDPSIVCEDIVRESLENSISCHVDCGKEPDKSTKGVSYTKNIIEEKDSNKV